jgi:hypothetical protein
MTTRSRFIGALSLLAVPALAAAHGNPAKAKILTSSLVQGFVECKTPNTTTPSGRPACDSAIEADNVCLFGHHGTGLLQAAVKGTGIKVKATLKGIEAGCDGKLLAVALRVRTTVECPSNERCTAVDEDLVGQVTCTVSNGKCTIKDTIQTGLAADEAATIQILSCGIRRGEVQAFGCGMSAP